MKTTDQVITRLLLVLFLSLGGAPLFAQKGDFFTVSGVVRDQRTRRVLHNVSVNVTDTQVGTVTNADGFFSLKIRHDLNAQMLELSYIGYQSRLIPLSGIDMIDATLYLSESAIVLDDIIIQNQDARALVEAAINRIDHNYSDKTSLLTGFYRETVQKRNHYINISEAVTQIYRTPYFLGTEAERTQIIKGRNLVSPKTSDTLAVKLQGGPNTYIFGDIVKNREMFLDLPTLDRYKFFLEGSVNINETPHFVVAFSPQVTIEDEVLYVGKLYISKQTLTFSRAEYALDMSDRRKVTQVILRRKPASLRFTPEEVSFVASYLERNGRSYLSYIRNEIQFKCDWRRRLFSTAYTIVSELVVTDGTDEIVSNIPVKLSFKPHQTLSDRVGDFFDPGFWEDYNIIEPSESLESAVDRLKRLQR